MRETTPRTTELTQGHVAALESALKVVHFEFHKLESAPEDCRDLGCTFLREILSVISALQRRDFVMVPVKDAKNLRASLYSWAESIAVHGEQPPAELLAACDTLLGYRSAHERDD